MDKLSSTECSKYGNLFSQTIELLHGRMKSVIHCDVCTAKKSKIVLFYKINCRPFESVKRILLELFTRQLWTDNDFSCPFCEWKYSAHVTYTLLKPPQFLHIGIQRANLYKEPMVEAQSLNIQRFISLSYYDQASRTFLGTHYSLVSIIIFQPIDLEDYFDILIDDTPIN